MWCTNSLDERSTLTAICEAAFGAAFDPEELEDLEALIGQELDVQTVQNPKGFARIKSFYPKRKTAVNLHGLDVTDADLPDFDRPQ